MRKLSLVLLLFVLSIITLILLFNTLTNTSKQTNIAVLADLPVYNNAVNRLAEAIRQPTIHDSLSNNRFKSFQTWLKQQYSTLFNNPNVSWQEFEGFSLVAKWVGRTPELAPIVLVANQHTENPSLERIPEWTYNPFMGKVDSLYIYGQGTQQGKVVMLALLEAFQELVKNNTLPDRTIYFAFPHDSQQGELAIINALKAANIQPQFILKTGGLIAQDLLWDIKSPTALIGVGRKVVMQAVLETKQAEATEIIQQSVQQLKEALPTIDMYHPALQLFISYLSPELNFGNRLVFSNQWLLNNIQSRRLAANEMTKHLFGAAINSNITTTDSTQTTLTTLTFTAPSVIPDLETWIKLHLQHPQIQVLGAPEVLNNNSTIAAINSHGYRLISNTSKEIFPNLITIPTLVQELSTINWQAHIKTDVYYYHPVIYNKELWSKAQQKIDRKISIKNYEQLIQFYNQLLLNGIK